MKKLDHGQLLDAKLIMDNVIGMWQELEQLIPECLHHRLESWAQDFESQLADCDVSDRYEEIQK
jgi:hypothetical protein